MALVTFWLESGYYGEVREWAERSLAVRDELPPSIKAKALLNADTIMSDDTEGTIELLEEGLNLYRELGDKRGIALAVRSIGFVYRYDIKGDFERAQELYEESLALSREAGDESGSADTLTILGVLAIEQGHFSQAKKWVQEGLALFRELGDMNNIAYLLTLLGSMAFHQDDYIMAKELFEESLTLRWERRDKLGIAMCLTGLGGVAKVEEGPERGARLLGAAEIIREVIGFHLIPHSYPYHDDFDRIVADLRDELGEEAFAAAWAEGRKMSMEEAVEYALDADG